MPLPRGWCLVLAVSLLKLCRAFSGGEVVEVGQGKLAGEWRKSLQGRRFAAFEGIPYAVPPVGERRFMAAEPSGPWQGVLRADKPPNDCLQWYNFGEDEYPIKGDEDCLYLNVYTPDPRKDERLPVIVYIHGGAFIFGSGAVYEPDFIIDRDVVFVTINYRLGPLGFLSTQDEVVPGNNGLKDQNLALKWVKDNIHHFGGDPNLITGMGMSAGAASVDYHLLSPRSQGLLQRGILESGSACCPWTVQTRPRERALQLGDYLGCPTESTKEMIECLKTRPASSIVNTVSIFMPFHQTPFSPFAPVVEPEGVEGTFITEHPYEMMKKGKFAKVPILASVTRDEGNFPGAIYAKKPEFMDILNLHWNELVPFMFDCNDTIATTRHALAAYKIKKHYLKGFGITLDTIQGLIDALGDRHFVNDIEKCSLVKASLGKEIYFYQFSYIGETSLGMYLSKLPRNYGVSHGDDTGYIIKTDYMDPTLNPEDRSMIEFMLDIVVSFAKDGKPKAGSIDWSPIGKGNDKLTYLEIKNSKEYSIKTTDSLGAREFWNDLEIYDGSNPKPIKDEL